MNTKSRVNVAQQHQGGGGATFSAKTKRGGRNKTKGGMSAKQKRKQLYAKQAVEGKFKPKPAQKDEVVSEHDAEAERYVEQVDDRNYAAFVHQQGW